VGEHPNATTFRRLIDGFNSGDMEAVMSMVADDIVWYSIGLAEPLRGADALAASALNFPEGVTVSAEIHDVVANDEHVVGLIKATATADGETFEYRTAEILHFTDGKVSERWAFSDDTARITEFFSQLG
jgi:ketosteroid isomerase-like protein